MDHSAEIKAYFEMKRAEREEAERLKAVTDTHTAEKIAEIRNAIRKEEEALEVARAKERIEQIKDSEDKEKKSAIAKEADQIEKDLRTHEKEQGEKIYEAVKHLPQDEQDKIYSVLQHTEDKKKEYENTKDETATEKLNRRAKEYDPTQEKAVSSNVWDEALACIGAAIITGVIELGTELPARMIKKQREQEKNELRQKEEAERKKTQEGVEV